MLWTAPPPARECHGCWVSVRGPTDSQDRAFAVVQSRIWKFTASFSEWEANRFVLERQTFYVSRSPQGSTEESPNMIVGAEGGGGDEPHLAAIAKRFSALPRGRRNPTGIKGYAQRRYWPVSDRSGRFWRIVVAGFAERMQSARPCRGSREASASV